MKARGLSCLAMVAAILGGMDAAPALAERYVLAVGIDKYDHLPVQDGAVADARSLAFAAIGGGARTTWLLTDRDATLDAIRTRWRSMMDASAPTDLLILAFSGVGAPVRMDEGVVDAGFVLSGFDPQTPEATQVLSPDELESMLQEARPRPVLMVRDYCSGRALVRERDERTAFGARRCLQAGAAQTAEASVERHQWPTNSVVLDAGPPEAAVFETPLAGEYRGALSWSVAQALDGAADSDGDGVVTVAELTGLAIAAVPRLTENRQNPVSQTGAYVDAASLVAARVTPEDLESPAGLPEIAIALHGPADADTALIDDLVGVRLETSERRADLIWDTDTGDILTPHGDVALRLGGIRSEQLIQGLVEKWRVVRALRETIQAARLRLVVSGGALRDEGDRFDLTVTSGIQGHLTLFAIEADGSLTMLEPSIGRAQETPVLVGPGADFVVSITVTPPAGADHIVALVTETAPRALLDLLEWHHGRPPSPDAAGRLISALLAPQVQAAILGVYSMR